VAPSQAIYRSNSPSDVASMGMQFVLTGLKQSRDRRAEQQNDANHYFASGA
jgi:hypothetical protein